MPPLNWTYSVSGFSYNTMKDGAVISMPGPKVFNGYLYWNQTAYLFWMKQNTTNCKF